MKEADCWEFEGQSTKEENVGYPIVVISFQICVCTKSCHTAVSDCNCVYILEKRGTSQELVGRKRTVGLRIHADQRHDEYFNLAKQHFALLWGSGNNAINR